MNPQLKPDYEFLDHSWSPAVGSEPRVDWDNRLSIIRWLVWNDRNGCYTDAECESEGLEPISLDDARLLMIEQANG
jgi:hypothetical protein